VESGAPVADVWLGSSSTVNVPAMFVVLADCCR